MAPQRTCRKFQPAATALLNSRAPCFFTAEVILGAVKFFMGEKEGGRRVVNVGTDAAPDERGD